MKKIHLLSSLLLGIVLSSCSLLSSSEKISKDMSIEEKQAHESRRYVSFSPEECSRIDFGCGEGTMLFNDESGCGCEAENGSAIADVENQDNPECGIINGEQVNCQFGEMCATVSWDRSPQVAKCYPENVCDKNTCAAGESCVVLESWPAQIRCVDNLEQNGLQEEEIPPAETGENIEAVRLQECPDEWIENRMPGMPEGDEANTEQYFIVDGERRELSEFDVTWVIESCPVNEPTPVS